MSTGKSFGGLREAAVVEPETEKVVVGGVNGGYPQITWLGPPRAGRHGGRCCQAT